MRKVLHINSSITGDNSVSRELSRELIERLTQTSEGIELIERDFSKQPIPHLDSARLGALFTPAEARSAEQNQAVAFADQLIDELMQADMVVIALPMYNFTIPSMLKAWVDHVARAGVTFQYTDTGPVGLLSGKKAYLVSALGGKHEAGGSDFMRPYMKLILNFVGITDIEFISADGLSMGDEPRAAGLAAARATISQIAA